MGAVIAEGLSAPMDYFLPARVLRSILAKSDFSAVSVTLEDPQSREEILFASGSAASGGQPKEEVLIPFGRIYKMRARIPQGTENMLVLLGQSLGPRMDAARPAPLNHPVPGILSPHEIAEAVSSRFADSQASFATLSVLNVESYTGPLIEAFPLINPSCLEKDILRILASFFEAAGGLFLSKDLIIGLTCSSAPTDIELLRTQLEKTLRRFVTSSVAAEVAIQASCLFETPALEPIEGFILEGRKKHEAS